MQERLYEQGVVISVKDEIAEVDISENGNCHECGAKMFCKPGSNDKKILTVINKFGAKIGDRVEISVDGGVLLKVSLMLYGAPLLILIVGILIGLEIFKNQNPTELYAFGSTIFILAIYYLLFFLLKGKKENNKSIMPKIVRIFKRD